jgi:DNA-binding MltR family transcriptional regulator
MGRNRGKPKMKLRDLSQLPPTVEEQMAMLTALCEGPPIARAIIGAVMVEHELERLLRRRFSRNDDVTWRELVSERGPLGTFSQKITIGYAFSIYNDETRTNLDVVRSIRNAFAHAKMPLDFSHKLIVAELAKIKTRNKRWQKQLMAPVTPTSQFSNLCMMVTMQLLKKQTTASKISATKIGRSQLRQSPYTTALMPFLLPPRPGLGFGTLAFLGRQTDDPKSSTPPGSLATILAEHAKSDDNKDK